MYARILVPVDGSPTSDAGLDEAIRLALMSGGALRLLHVVDDMPFIPMSAIHGVVQPDLSASERERGQALLERCAARARDAGVEAGTALVEGLGRRLVDFIGDQVESWDAELIVLGTHGRRGLGRALLGSDAEQVVRAASVPVLLVRNAGADARPGAASEREAVA